MGWSSDFEYQKSTGEEFKGVSKAWEALKETYAPFASHVHDPSWLLCWETEKGWDMVDYRDTLIEDYASADLATSLVIRLA